MKMKALGENNRFWLTPKDSSDSPYMYCSSQFLNAKGMFFTLTVQAIAVAELSKLNFPLDVLC